MSKNKGTKEAKKAPAANGIKKEKSDYQLGKGTTSSIDTTFIKKK